MLNFSKLKPQDESGRNLAHSTRTFDSFLEPTSWVYHGPDARYLDIKRKPQPHYRSVHTPRIGALSLIAICVLLWAVAKWVVR